MGIASSPSVTRARSRATQAAGVLSEWLRPVLGPVLGIARKYGEYALGVTTALGMMVTIWAALIFAPTDSVQGNDQRIVYFHVPVAWVAFLAFFIVFGASILYLVESRLGRPTALRWDRLAWASA